MKHTRKFKKSLRHLEMVDDLGRFTWLLGYLAEAVFGFNCEDDPGMMGLSTYAADGGLYPLG